MLKRFIIYVCFVAILAGTVLPMSACTTREALAGAGGLAVGAVAAGLIVHHEDEENNGSHHEEHSSYERHH